MPGLRWRIHSGPFGYWVGNYEPEVQGRIKSILKPGDHVLDIGANTGFYTLLSSRLVGRSGRVTAFEPLPRNIEFLRTHVRLNRLENVEIVEAAVSDASGKVRFKSDTHASMGYVTTNGDLEVDSVSLDQLFQQKRLAPAKLLKIDVEGEEYRVIKGALSYLMSCHPTILLSGHGTEAQKNCESFLAGLGYSVKVERDGSPTGHGDGMYESIFIWHARS